MVYGRTVQCYSLIGVLLEMGIEGSWITLAQPPLAIGEKPSNAFFNDDEVTFLPKAHHKLYFRAILL